MKEEGTIPNWTDYIHSDPEVLQGKPVVKGTRLAVDFILGLFAAGWAEQEVLDSYPTLTRDALRAVFAFSAGYLHARMFQATSSSQ